MWEDLHYHIMQPEGLPLARQLLAGFIGDRPVNTLILAASFAEPEAVDLLRECGWSLSAADDRVPGEAVVQ